MGERAETLVETPLCLFKDIISVNSFNTCPCTGASTVLIMKCVYIFLLQNEYVFSEPGLTKGTQYPPLVQVRLL